MCFLKWYRTILSVAVTAILAVFGTFAAVTITAAFVRVAGITVAIFVFARHSAIFGVAVRTPSFLDFMFFLHLFHCSLG